MSILSKPQVRPDAVQALLRFLSVQKKNLNEEEVCMWMVPAINFLNAKEKLDALRERVKDVRDVASELGFVQPKSWRLVKDIPSDPEEFGDMLHNIFTKKRESFEILDVYAAMVVEIERNGILWLRKSINEVSTTLRDRVSKPDPEGNTVTFNDTRWRAWVSWVTFMGLGLTGPGNIAQFLPHPTIRLERVLQTHPDLIKGEEIPADEFLQYIGSSLPYLDGGKRLEAAWFRAGDQQGREVSRVLSSALLDLDKRGVIELRYEGGDRTSARRIADAKPGREAFASLQLGRKGKK